MKFFLSPVIAVVLAAVSLQAAPQSGGTQPGRYTDWHDVDQVTIAQPFQLRNYKSVVVAPLDTRNAPLPPEKDNTYQPVKAALANATQPFSEGLRNKLADTNVQVQSGSKGGAEVLIVRARITKSDPGSQAARYLGGFGAGAAKVGVSGEVVDGKSGKTLLQFKQERRSGFGMFGGGYRELLDRSMRQIGGDVAGLLKAF